MPEYRRILAEVDAWYRSVKERFPEKVPCGRGCRDCCLGLFDISKADAALLREGLAGADPAVQEDIARRASEIMGRLRALRPRLGADLDGWSARDIDDLCDELEDVECPVLGREGECRLYEHRPLICRLSGIPVVDRGGAIVQPEGCAKCTLRPNETPPLDVESIRRRERKVLKRLDPGSPGATMVIAQALEPR